MSTMSQRRLETDAQVKKVLANCKSEDEKIQRYLRIAQQYLYIEEYCEAEKYLLRHIKAKPDSNEAHKLVGELYLKLQRYQCAFDSLKRCYELKPTKDVLGSICQAAPHLTIGLAAKQDWLKKAEKENLSQTILLALREAVLREGESTTQEMEDVLKEQATLYPLDPESQVKLVSFYSESNRHEDCIKVILKEEAKQEMRNSPRWYRECQKALETCRAQNIVPFDQNLSALQLHVAARLALGLITDPFFIADKEKGSVGMEGFFKQLEYLDRLLDEALTNRKWYREGLWAFILDHFTGQLLYIFALGMLRRGDESNREDVYKNRGLALMFCALEYRPKKIKAEPWFMKAKDDFKQLLNEMYLDGCYRTTSSYRCLANTSTDSALCESVKLAASGASAVKFVCERVFPTKAVSAVYTQTVISRACSKLPDKAVIAPFEMNSCVKFAGSLEHLVWLLLSGAEMPTEKIFSTLPMVPNVVDGAQTPSQSDIDAFLAAVVAAVKVFGNKLDIVKPTVPREIMHRSFTTSKQQNFWMAVFRNFVNKVNLGRDIVQSKKLLNDGLEIIRGQDSKKTIPVYYLVQIARELYRKGKTRNTYYQVAVKYYKLVLNRLDDHIIPSLNGGSRSSPSYMFELPKTMTVSEDTSSYRDEARLKIGKHLLHNEEFEAARAILELVQTPKAYFYFAKTAQKLSAKYVDEGDSETAERLLEKAKHQLIKGINLSRSDPQLHERLKHLLDSIDDDQSSYWNMRPKSPSHLNSNKKAETALIQDVDFARIEALVEKNTAKVLAESAQRAAQFEAAVGELKAMQQNFIETLGKVLADTMSLNNQSKQIALSNSDLKIKVSQVSQQIVRLEDIVCAQQAVVNDYVDVPDVPQMVPATSQPYPSGGLIFPTGAGLPQFNLTSVQHPSVANVSTSQRANVQAQRPTITSTQETISDDQVARTRILFDSEGVLFEERPGETDLALGGYHKIAVLEMPDRKGGVQNALYYFDDTDVYAVQSLDEITPEMCSFDDASTNLFWTYRGRKYYIEFADLSWQPARVLAKVLMSVGLKVMNFDTSMENIPAALAVPPQTSALQNMAKMAEDLNKTKTPTSQTSIAASSPILASMLPKPTPMIAAPAPTPTSYGGFSFNTQPVMGTVTKDVTPGKPQPVGNAASPFAGLSFQTQIETKPSTGLFGSAGATKTPETKPTTGLFGAAGATNTLETKPTTGLFGAAGATNTLETKPTTGLFGSAGATNILATKPTTGLFGSAGATNTPALNPPAPMLGLNPAPSSTAPAAAFATPAAPSFSFSNLSASTATNAFATPSSNAPAEVKSAFSSFSFSAPATKPAASSSFSFGVSSAVGPSAVKFDLKPSSITLATSPVKADHEDQVEEYEPNVDFKPVIDLPDLVEVKTGEEGEEVLFCERAKLYRFASETKEWKERGLGELKILKNTETGKYRVLMRREQVLKLCANHQIIAGLKISTRPKENEMTWAAPDFADEEVRHEQFVVRFKTKEQADKFKTIFEEGVTAANNYKSPQKPEKPAENKESKSFGDKFKPASGSWACSTCYVENASSALKCLACESAKPGSKPTAESGADTASNKSSQPPPKSDDLMAKFKAKPGSWNCTGCFLSNSADATNCIACEALKPGASPAPKTESKPASSFKFGLASVSTAASSSPAASAPKVAPTFSFGMKSTPAVSTTTSSGFVFGQAAPAGALASSPPKFTFGSKKDSLPAVAPVPPPAPASDTATTPEQKPFSIPQAGFSFGSPQKHEFSFNQEEDDDVVPESQDRDFEPVLAVLPPEVEVVTGEEGQECLLSQKAKLFRYADKQWKERGVGEFKILRDPTTGKVRVTMRREQVFKVCLNHYLTNDIGFTRKDERSIEWNAVDFAEGSAEPTLFALRVRNSEVADKVLNALEEAKAKATSSPTKSSQSESSIQPVPSQEFPKNLSPRNLFASPVKEDDLEVVKIEKASDSDVARARKLLLPDNFYLYESRSGSCKGCRGCEDHDGSESGNAEATADTPKECEAETPKKSDGKAEIPKMFDGKAETPKMFDGKAETPKMFDGKAETPKMFDGKAETPKKSDGKAETPKTSSTAEITIKSLGKTESASAETPKPIFGASASQSAAKVEVVPTAEPTSDYLFGTNTTLSFSALAQSTGNDFAFGNKSAEGANTWNLHTGSSFFTSFTKEGMTAKPREIDLEGDVVTPSDDIYFEPVIPMPDLVKVTTGEEEDEVLYTQRAKLYVYHTATSEWKERALGDAKILRCGDGRARIVVRRDMVHKVACNHYITDNMEVKPLATSSNSVTWAAVDFSEGEATPTTFALRVKGEDRLREFVRIFNEEIDRAKKKEDAVDAQDSMKHAETPKHEPTSNDSREETDEDEENILFLAGVYISEDPTLGQSMWEDIGDGIVQVVYNDDIFGLVIHLLRTNDQAVLAETVIAVQTSLREEGLSAIWMAQDTSQNPAKRRRFRVTFSNADDISKFSTIFAEGKDSAVECGIVEVEDPVPAQPRHIQ